MGNKVDNSLYVDNSHLYFFFVWFHCGILVYERVPYVRGFSGNCPPPTQKNTKLRNWVFFVFLRTSRIFSKIHNFAQISSTTLYPLTYQIVVLTGPSWKRAAKNPATHQTPAPLSRRTGLRHLCLGSHRNPNSRV